MRILTISSLALALSMVACADDADEKKVETKKEVKAEVETSVQKKTSKIVAVKEGSGGWEKVLASEHRSAKHKLRDQYRHPQETLEFFGIKPGMTVVEIWPGGQGWYTEILAPFLGPNGKLYAAQFDQNTDVEYFQKGLKSFKDKLAADADVYNNVEITTFHPPEVYDVAPAESADAVLTFRNVHNWLRNGREETVAAFKEMHKVLRPGGVLGVVEHRLPKSMEQDEKASSGYMHQQFVIDVAEEAGFKLIATSEVNANPKDTADHPKGVWTLPPSLRLGDEDKEKYLSIGESDRMTLKFAKPAAK